MPLEAEAGLIGRSLSSYTRILTLVIIGLLGGLVAWSNLVSIQGAVIASGTVISEGNRKLLQHRVGGVIAELNISDGDRVNSGDVLIKLDGQQLSSELEGVEKKLHELRLRKIRLDAEAHGDPIEQGISNFTSSLKKSQNNELQALTDVQVRLHRSRTQSYESRLIQLNKQVAALEVELQGVEELVLLKRDELKLIDHEIGLLSKLEKKSLVSLSRIAPLRRERARIMGELVRNKSRTSKIPKQLAETKAAIVELRSKRIADIQSELEKVEGEILQHVERREILEDRISRLDIRAPVSGYIHELTAHTQGGVIQAGETIASIVPENANLSVDARVDVDDRESVSSGGSARIRFTAFNSRTAPEVDGRVEWLSPDISVDERTGRQYYSARISIPDNPSLGEATLPVSPGMMAEVFITTKPRTVASFLVSPIVDQFNRAFREN